MRARLVSRNRLRTLTAWPNGYASTTEQGGGRMDIGRLTARAVIGGLFVGHGTQKLFGWFGAQGARRGGGGGGRGGTREGGGAPQPAPPPPQPPRAGYRGGGGRPRGRAGR